MNNTGIRADLTPGPTGALTFGAIYAVQPFANDLVTRTFTGLQIKALLEQQVDGKSFDHCSRSRTLLVRADMARPIGARVSESALRPADRGRCALSGDDEQLPRGRRRFLHRVSRRR